MELVVLPIAAGMVGLLGFLAGVLTGRAVERVRGGRQRVTPPENRGMRWWLTEREAMRLFLLAALLEWGLIVFMVILMYRRGCL